MLGCLALRPGVVPGSIKGIMDLVRRYWNELCTGNRACVHVCPGVKPWKIAHEPRLCSGHIEGKKAHGSVGLTADHLDIYAALDLLLGLSVHLRTDRLWRTFRLGALAPDCSWIRCAYTVDPGT